VIEANPAAYNQLINDDGTLMAEKISRDTVDYWDGVVSKKDMQGLIPTSQAEADRKAQAIKDEVTKVDIEAEEGIQKTVDDLEIEPPLTVDQYVIDTGTRALANTCRINSLEQKFAAGLIEEVLQVAEGELELVDEMLRNQVYVHVFHFPAAQLLTFPDGSLSKRRHQKANGPISNVATAYDHAIVSAWLLLPVHM